MTDLVGLVAEDPLVAEMEIVAESQFPEIDMMSPDEVIVVSVVVADRICWKGFRKASPAQNLLIPEFWTFSAIQSCSKS